ncbi:hypothetical protein EYF80_000429 [Liparis tanakae]|uniref:Uncharacterized protein n=1 Tax=Liparis tanakae TaxID=230148 RepID=A0A4Z2JGP4_9TELE|nr:hypothetical protein EYF80_000429 [Liparis tanakae]
MESHWVGISKQCSGLCRKLAWMVGSSMAPSILRHVNPARGSVSSSVSRLTTFTSSGKLNSLPKSLITFRPGACMEATYSSYTELNSLGRLLNRPPYCWDTRKYCCVFRLFKLDNKTMADVPILWKIRWLFMLSRGNQLHLNREWVSGPSNISATAGKDSSGWEQTSVRLSGVTKFTSPLISVTSTTSISKLEGNFKMFVLTVQKK